MNEKNILPLYKCIPSNKFLSSNSWEEASEELQNAHEFPLVLFISHRWEAYNNPDVSGQQYRAIKVLIEHIVSAVHAIVAMDKGEHHQYIEELGKHGVLQGAMIGTRLFSSIAELTLNGDSSQNLTLENEPERLIGIWYDAYCLPQGKRSKEEILVFQSVLQNLPNFVEHPKVSVVALQEANDNYEQRSWCMMEFMLATQQSTYSPLVYRYDLEGKALEINNHTDAGLDFTASLEYWRKANKTEASKAWQSIFLQANTLPDSLLSDNILSTLSMRTRLTKFIAVQSALFLDEKKTSPLSEPLKILMKLQEKSELVTSLPEDGILTYLMILVGGCSLKNPLREEFEMYLKEVILLRDK